MKVEWKWLLGQKLYLVADQLLQDKIRTNKVKPVYPLQLCWAGGIIMYQLWALCDNIGEYCMYKMNQPKTYPLGIISSLCGSCLNQRNFECPIAESTAAHVQSYQTNTPAFLKILDTIVLGISNNFLALHFMSQTHNLNRWIWQDGNP